MRWMPSATGWAPGSVQCGASLTHRVSQAARIPRSHPAQGGRSVTLVPSIGVLRPLPRAPDRETLDETRPEEDRHVGTGVRRTRFARLERGAGPDGAGPRRRDRARGRHHDLRHRPAHPQGGRAHRRPGAGARSRGRRHRRGHRRGRARDRRGGPRAGLVHHLVRTLPLLPRRPLRPVPERWRLDPGPPDRRDAGGVRPDPLRGHVAARAARAGHRRGGRAALGHPAHLLRGRRAQRDGAAGGHGGHRGCRADRPGGCADGPTVQPHPHRRRRPGRGPT